MHASESQAQEAQVITKEGKERLLEMADDGRSERERMLDGASSFQSSDSILYNLGRSSMIKNRFFQDSSRVSSFKNISSAIILFSCHFLATFLLITQPFLRFPHSSPSILLLHDSPHFILGKEIQRERTKKMDMNQELKERVKDERRDGEMSHHMMEEIFSSGIKMREMRRRRIKGQKSKFSSLRPSNIK